MNELNQSMKSVKSINRCKSVIQMSYDIITKGHGGDLRVESTVGKGTVLKIELPYK